MLFVPCKFSSERRSLHRVKVNTVQPVARCSVCQYRLGSPCSAECWRSADRLQTIVRHDKPRPAPSVRPYGRFIELTVHPGFSGVSGRFSLADGLHFRWANYCNRFWTIFGFYLYKISVPYQVLEHVLASKKTLCELSIDFPIKALIRLRIGDADTRMGCAGCTLDFDPICLVRTSGDLVSWDNPVTGA